MENTIQNDNTKKKIKKILIIPSSHVSLGLFCDLEKTQTEILVAEWNSARSLPMKLLRKLYWNPCINQVVHLPLKEKWCKPISLKMNPQEETYIIVVDSALRALNLKMLNQVCKSNNVHCSLVLLNSMDAYSMGMLEVKYDFPRVSWESIFTFDWHDAQQYNYQYLGCCYYSKHDEQKIMEKYGADAPCSDIYFTGGLKGNRKDIILDVFSYLNDNGITADFNILAGGKERVGKKMFKNKIRYYSNGWIPYKQVLAHVLRSKVILEVLQEGQYGPSVRYYEAVCYNKKLLTNNPYIVDLPYYNEKYMKVFHKVSDIDLKWLLEDEEIDYGYQGEFSPIHLFDRVFLQ